jgi:hypothetical protein
MFGKTTDDIAATLMAMHDRARIECRHNQYAMAEKMASWMAQDRRFDSVTNKIGLANDAMDARSHGRELNLSGQLRVDTAGAATAPVIGRR